MIYRIFNINDMTEDTAAHYFSLMSEQKKQKIINAKDKIRGAQAFVAEMLARQCLSELADAPEFSFSLLLNPNSKSIVSNFDAEISIAANDEYVACAVSHYPIGISVEKASGFTFAEAQSLLSDSEIRNLFSVSRFSFSELVNAEICDEMVLQKRFAQFKTLKTAQFYSSGRGIRDKSLYSYFEITDDSVKCLDDKYTVALSDYFSDKKLAISIIERCS